MIQFGDRRRSKVGVRLHPNRVEVGPLGRGGELRSQEELQYTAAVEGTLLRIRVGESHYSIDIPNQPGSARIARRDPEPIEIHLFAEPGTGTCRIDEIQVLDRSPRRPPALDPVPAPVPVTDPTPEPIPQDPPTPAPNVHRIEPPWVRVGEVAELSVVGTGLDRLSKVRWGGEGVELEVLGIGALATGAPDRRTITVRASRPAESRGTPATRTEGPRPDRSAPAPGGPSFPPDRTSSLVVEFSDPRSRPETIPIAILPAPVVPGSSTPWWLTWTAVGILLGGFSLGFPTGRWSQWIWPGGLRSGIESLVEGRNPLGLELGRWRCRVAIQGGVFDHRVTSLGVHPIGLEVAGAPEGSKISADYLGPLNDHASLRAVLDDRDEVRQQLRPLGDAVVGSLQAWLDAGHRPTALGLRFEAEKPLVLEFTLERRRTRGPSAGEWREVRTWTRNLPARQSEEFAILDGPEEEEHRPSQRIRDESLEALVDLAQRIRKQV